MTLDECKNLLENAHVKLPKTISYRQLSALIIGSMIGSGIFVSPQGVLIQTGSSGMALVVWALTGLVVLLESLCFVELALTIPRAGADYIYIKEGLGDGPAFLYMWCTGVFLQGASGAILALTFSSYFCQVFWMDCAPPVSLKKLVALLALAILTSIQCYSNSAAVRISDILSGAKLAGVIFIITFGLSSVISGRVHNQLEDSIFAHSSPHPGSYVVAFYSAYFAYSGMKDCMNVIEEMEEPLKENVLKAVFLAVTSVTVIYLLTNLSYVAVLTPAEMRSSEAVAMIWEHKLFPGLSWMMPLIVAASTFGTINNGLINASRAKLANARERHLPRPLALLHKDYRTPIPILISNLFVCTAFVSFSGLNTLILYTSYTGAVGSFASLIVLFKLRFICPDRPTQLKLPLCIPIIYLFVQFFLLIMPFYQVPWETILSCLFLLSGWPAYYLFILPEKNPDWLLRWEQKVTQATQILCSVLPETTNTVDAR